MEQNDNLPSGWLRGVSSAGAILYLEKGAAIFVFGQTSRKRPHAFMQLETGGHSVSLTNDRSLYENCLEAERVLLSQCMRISALLNMQTQKRMFADLEG